MKRNFLIAGLAIFVLASCENTNHNHTHNPPNVMIMAPTAGSSYNNNDTVHMTIHMEDDDELHMGSVYIKSATDTFFSYMPSIHAMPHFHKDTFWVVSGISGATAANICAMASNHHGGADTAMVNITLNP